MPATSKVFRVKSPTAPVATPIRGVRKAVTNPVTTAVKAAPITMPTARSTTFPRSRKLRNPLSTGNSKSVRGKVGWDHGPRPDILPTGGARGPTAFTRSA